MSITVRALRRSLVALSLSLAPLSAGLAACASGDREEAAADSAVDDSAAAATPSTDAAPSPAPEVSDAPLEAADVDRWQKGMDAELQAVKDAAAKLAAATSGMDSLSAINATTEMSTRAAGAAAAGVSEDRYQHIRGTLGELVGQMVPSEMETGSQMPAAMVEQMKQGREAGLAKLVGTLPPSLVEAVRPRAAALRTQQLTLVGERMRAAGIGKR